MIKKIAVAVIFLIALFVGFQLFVSGPRGEVSRLQESVKGLESGIEVGPDTVVLELPPRNRLVADVKVAARKSGVTVDEINFLDGRVEIVTQSDPAAVAGFARSISSGEEIQAVAIDGSLLPQSVVTVEPRE